MVAAALGEYQGLISSEWTGPNMEVVEHTFLQAVSFRQWKLPCELVGLGPGPTFAVDSPCQRQAKGRCRTEASFAMCGPVVLLSP